MASGSSFHAIQTFDKNLYQSASLLHVLGKISGPNGSIPIDEITDTLTIKTPRSGQGE